MPITFFFEELMPAGESAGENDAVMVALRDPMAVELVKAFVAIPDATFRRRILDLLRAASGTEQADAAGMGDSKE